MAKSSISKDDVYLAALTVQKEGEIPTTINVRAKLNGHGSQTTIHKHLTRWKKLYANDRGDSIDELRTKLGQQQQIIENLSLELCNSRQLAASESDENTKLRGRVLELELRLEQKELSAQESLMRSECVEKTLKGSFDTAVLLLSEQIRTINAQAIQKVQEAGQHYDDKVMDLKLELRDLKDQLALNDKEVKKLSDELIERTLQSKAYG